MFDINNLLRDNIKNLKPYSSARDEFKGDNAIFLDANENPYNKPYNRYPDPLHRDLREKISEIKNVPTENIFLGNGSDEPIDLLIRAFCEPTKDSILSVDPTYGMYKVCADINNVEFNTVKLRDNFQLDVDKIISAIKDNTKLIFLCSPNNPTGNSLKLADILQIIKSFKGIVVLDEAYIDFTPNPSLIQFLKDFPNLVILQTFSKAWGLAGIRLGMAFANNEIVSVLNKIKYPYNLNILTQRTALEELNNVSRKNAWVNEIIEERSRLANEIEKLPYVSVVLPSDANFFLFKTQEPKKIYNYLIEKNIVIRDRSKVTLCEGCLRISIGTNAENNELLFALKNYK
jgi:histidinol-phosphate aminotransferase